MFDRKPIKRYRYSEIKLALSGVCINNANTSAFYRWHSKIRFQAPTYTAIGVHLRGKLIALVHNNSEADRVMLAAIDAHVSSTRAHGRVTLAAHCKTYRSNATFCTATQSLERYRRNSKALHRKRVRLYGLRSVRRSPLHNAEFGGTPFKALYTV